MISNSAWLGGNFISDFSKILIKWKCISVYHGLLFSFLSCLAVTPSKSYSSNLHFSMQGMQNTLKTVWLCNPLLFETGYFVTCADTDKHAIADHPSVFHAQGRREPEGYPSRLRAQGGTRPTHHRAQPHMHLATPISLRHMSLDWSTWRRTLKHGENVQKGRGRTRTPKPRGARHWP